MSQPKVSVVVAVRNEEKHIAQCLQSLIDQDYLSDSYEILVVDGRSQDRTRDIVASFLEKYPQIRLLDNPKVVYPAGLNIGIREARGEVIIKVDGHAFVARDFLSKSVAYLQKTGAAVVGGPVATVGKGYIGRAIAGVLSSPFGVGDARFRYSRKEGYVNTVPFGAYWKKTFDEVGLFKESLQRVEDLELHSRIRQKGGKFFLTPEIKSTYHSRATLKGLIRQAFSSGYEVGAMRRVVLPRHLVPLAFVSLLLVLLLLAIFTSMGRILLLAFLGAYFLGALIFSLKIGLERGAGIIPISPILFFLFHFSYGIGSLWSLARRAGAVLPILTRVKRKV